MLETERFEEIHVDDGRAGRDDGVNHVVAHHVAPDMHAATGRCGPGEGQDDRTIGISHCLLQDARSPRRIARGEGHLFPRIDDHTTIKGGDVDMLDRIGEQFGFFV